MIAAIGLGELLWSLLVLYIIIQVIIVTVVVVLDVFRSDDLGGAAKAMWVLALLVFPLVTVIVYLFARGDGIGERNLARVSQVPPPPPGYPPPPPPGAASELQVAKRLLDEGTISASEFDDLKRRLLA